MEEQDEINPAYIRGFNEGYLIAQHMPELAQQLATAKGDHTRLDGFRAGREQYQAEQTKDRLPSWLKGDRSASEQRGLSKSKDRDIEPEK